MKTREFKKLNDQEKKAILCGVIAKRTEGKLSKENIINIVNQLDVNLQYTIKVITEAKEFAKSIILKEHGFSHSWAGSQGIKQEGSILLGSIEFGIDKDWGYSDNGRETEPDIKVVQPNFNVNEIAVIWITENEYDHFNNPSNEYDNWKDIIYIYIPESESYKLDDNIKALIDAFKIV